MNEALNLNKTEEITEDTTLEAPEALEEAKETIFINSLQILTEDDIILNETAQNVKKPPVDYVRYFILLVLTGIFIYSGYSIIMMLFGYAEAANMNNSILETFYSNEEVGEVQTLKKAKANNPIKDILSLQKQNVRQISAIVSDGISEADKKRMQLDKFSDIPDLYGWIRISNTKIEYPVVQAKDDEYYLYRNVYGHSQQSGSIYVDSRNDKNIDKNLNTILYGHNMSDRTMFSDLMNFYKYQDLFDNGIIEFTTQDGIYYYEIFSVHKAHPELYYRETTFQANEELGLSAEEEYVRWLYEMKSFSVYQKDYIEFTPESKIITLSTCTNIPITNPRLAVHGVLIDVLRYSD